LPSIKTDAIASGDSIGFWQVLKNQLQQAPFLENINIYIF